MQRRRWIASCLAAACAALLAVPVAAAERACSAASGATLLPVVELYTSEGCDSCPPADAWLARAFPVEDRVPKASVLAFHVDYWDRLGWRDRFASASYTARQNELAEARDSRLVYTPQLLVQGRDLGLWRQAHAEEAVTKASRQSARARVAITAHRSEATVVVDVEATLVGAARDPVVEVALTESGLASAVSAGENAGRKLVHDHVVRAFASGPRFASGSAQGSARLALPAERGAHPAIVALVRDRRTGDVLQSVRLDQCEL